MSLSTITERIRLKRRINRMERRYYELGAFISNHGIYPGWKSDVDTLERFDAEIEKLREVLDSANCES